RMADKQSTKERIMKVAQRLFADRGLDGTSMRDITDTAGVNLASVNYHFGSKDGLISAVFERHLTPVNEERLAMLDEAETSTEGPAGLGKVLEAFIRPAITRAMDPNQGDDSFVRLMGRCLSEPEAYAEKHIYTHFEKLAERFNIALARAVPGLAADEVFWRMIFVAGALHYALHVSSTNKLPMKPDNPPGAENLIRQLIAFTVAGMKSRVTDRSHAGSEH
ncbi:MAG: TetR family transcriptional regulator, partial [Syntrophobacteraceae bacterium]